MTIQPAIAFGDLGTLCHKVEAAYKQDDYRERFDWIDYIQPVTDPTLRAQLELEVVRPLQKRFRLASPEFRARETGGGLAVLAHTSNDVGAPPGCEEFHRVLTDPEHAEHGSLVACSDDVFHRAKLPPSEDGHRVVDFCGTGI